MTSGYAGGGEEEPTYEQVSTGRTGYVEVVEVEYNSSEVSLHKLLEIFFAAHDPTQVNGQGNDIGPQYRSSIFYTNEEQKVKSQKFIESKRVNYSDPIVTEVLPLDQFHPAEEYHQDYYARNPDQGYSRNVIAPKVKKVKKVIEK